MRRKYCIFGFNKNNSIYHDIRCLQLEKSLL